MSVQSRGRIALFSNYRWIPWLFVAVFLLVFAVNGGLVYFASKSWPGLASADAYDAGIKYNRELAKEEKEAKLGWSLSTQYRPTGALAYEIAVTVRDGGGQALEGAAVTGELERPVGQTATVPLHFVSQGAGLFLARVTVPSPGQWDVYLSARRGSDTVHGGRRLVVSER